MTGSCEHCGESFVVELLHNGFGDSAYAYCDTCGKTAVLSGWCKEWPQNVKGIHGEMASEMEAYLKPCECGGKFRKGGHPRCPACKNLLSAEEASAYIENQSPGTKGGWRWQRNWHGVYCIIINSQRVTDNFVVSKP